MKVESFNSLSSVSLNSLVRAKYTQGSISLPVNSSSMIHSNLKHIRGIPAFGGSPGYSLSRLRTLDNLIDRLQGLKGFNFAEEKRNEAGLLNSSSELEKLNETLKNELVDVLTSRISGFLGSEKLDSGLLLDISV